MCPPIPHALETPIVFDASRQVHYQTTSFMCLGVIITKRSQLSFARLNSATWMNCSRHRQHLLDGWSDHTSLNLWTWMVEVRVKFEYVKIDT